MPRPWFGERVATAEDDAAARADESVYEWFTRKMAETPFFTQRYPVGTPHVDLGPLNYPALERRRIEDLGEAVTPPPLPAGVPVAEFVRSVDWGAPPATPPATSTPGREGGTALPAPTDVPPPTAGAQVPTDVLQRGMMALLSPEMMTSRLQEMEEAGGQVQRSYAEEQAMLAKRLTERHTLETAAIEAMNEFRAGYREARPEAPKLTPSPAAPDVKIRPWLDPEGKNALTVIAQSLGALVTGLGGIVLNAPRTAMAQLRQAAEDWRRDELDAAASNWKQFQVSMEKIQADNAQALQAYELADKRYGANIQAKQAAVLSNLQALGLHDNTTLAASAPYQVGREATEKALATTQAITKGILEYGTVMAKWQKAKADLPPTEFRAAGELQRLSEVLPSVTDPAERANVEARMRILADTIKDYRQGKMALAREYAGVGMARVQLPKMQDRLDMVARLTDRVEALDEAYRTLDRKGLLRGSPSPLSGWIAKARQFMPGQWDEDAAQAFGVIENFFSQVNVTEARTILDEVGTRFKAAYGKFSDNPMMAYQTWVGIRKQMAAMLGEADRTYRAHVRLYRRSLGQLPGALTEDDSEAEE